MRHVLRTVVGLLSACTLHPLPDVPIDGGTEATRAAVRAELAAFDTAVGVGRLELREIRFSRDLTFLGRYTPRTHLLELHPSLAPDEVAPVLRHELCHALDDSEDLLVQPDLSWDQVAAHLDSDATIDAQGPDARLLRSEAMACLCGGGPDAAAILAAACDGDTPWMGEAHRWLLDHVWTGFDPPPVTVPPPARSWVPDVEEVDHLLVVGTTEPYVVQVGVVVASTAYAQSDVVAYLDLRSGPVDLNSWDVALDASSRSSSVTDLVPGTSSHGEAVVLADGTAAVLHVNPTALPSSADRLLWSEGDRWQFVEGGCRSDQELLVSADRAWVLWGEQDEVWWQQVGR